MKKSLESIRADAAEFLSRRGHSRRELEEKLRRRHPPKDVRIVLGELEAYGYLNDQEFAFDRARHLRETRLWGDRRISLDLRRVGISARIISLVLVELNRTNPQGECLQLLVESWLEKSGEPRTSRSAMKLFNYCVARGFPRSLVRQTLQPILQSLDWTA